MTTYNERKLAWWKWHRGNPHIYQEFIKFTNQAIDAGHTQLSAWLIINRIRWETTIVTQGEDFKVPNDYIAFYARLFMAEHPEHTGLFTTTTMKGENENSLFEQFWQQYPKKEAKGEARLAFYQAIETGVEPEKIISGIELSPRLKVAYRFIPHATKWLYSQGWEDKKPPPQAAANHADNVLLLPMGRSEREKFLEKEVNADRDDESNQWSS